MSEWLHYILKELDGVLLEDNAEPAAGSMQGDHVVGAVSLELRKVWSLMVSYYNLSAEAANSLTNLQVSEFDERRQEAARYHSQADVLREIFWVSCRREFPELWGKPSIGIRKGWNVVWMDPRQERVVSIMAAIDGASLQALMGFAGSEDDSDDGSGRRPRSH